MQITGKTKIAGLFGYPVSHTLSPRMHNSAFNKLHLDAVYLPFSVHPSELKNAVMSIRTFGFLGINITVPHKQTVMKYLDKITDSAKLIGAVNTIVVDGKKLIGHNTDGMGFVRSIEDDCGYKLKEKTMFLLGAGGAGRAVAIQSAFSGIKKIFISDTLEARAKNLRKSIPERCEVCLVNKKNEMYNAIQESDIIVNATPIGMHKEDSISIPAEYIPKGCLVYDVIYNPPKTKLLKSVRGCRIVNGLGMLLYQGVSAFELWTGQKAPVGTMREALIHA